MPDLQTNNGIVPGLLIEGSQCVGVSEGLRRITPLTAASAVSAQCSSKKSSNLPPPNKPNTHTDPQRTQRIPLQQACRPRSMTDVRCTILDRQQQSPTARSPQIHRVQQSPRLRPVPAELPP